MTQLVVDARWQPAFRHLKLATAEAVMALFGGETAVRRAEVVVRPETIQWPGGEALQVFLKQYCYPQASGRFWLRASKARREFENYAVFERLGIACAQRMAFGETRDWLGRLRHAFLLTRAVPNAGTLEDFLQRSCGAPACEATNAAAVSSKLAGMTRRLHEAAFFHNDLYCRNVLVDSTPGQPAHLCWIDCPRGSFTRAGFWHHHRRIKDLAALDRAAAQYCSRTQRLRFIKEYLGQSRLDAAGKQLVREILAYRRERWPEDAV